MDTILQWAHELSEIVLQQWSNVFATLFSKELDFITKMLTAFCFFTIFLECVYLAMPRSIKRRIEKLDYNPEIEGSYSMSASIAMANVVLLLVTIVSKFSGMKSPESKMSEGMIEREFRHR